MRRFPISLQSMRQAMPNPPEARRKKHQALLNLGWTITITLLITLIMTVLTASFGGFGSQDAKEGAARGFSLPIILHFVTAFPALILGPIVLIRRKGDRLHRLLGRIWVGLLLVSAAASAFIHSPGGGVAGTGFSFIHGFTVWTIVCVPLGVWFARTGKVEAHRSIMTGLYTGLVIAGLTTLIPGRLFGNLLFG
ncbi:DUF2306 domain-containing protein [Novosphingobium sp.]|uniref:DUF2306 domain-containing protein n=1 Tax=Novosphingobium sp. TaxID=1874826 RepID=UPI00262B8080|nr:DUF2306 domain-containing protein [Novosphingobium sp.]